MPGLSLAATIAVTHSDDLAALQALLTLEGVRSTTNCTTPPELMRFAACNGLMQVHSPSLRS